mgnify:CR=1 FL=1
MVLLGNLGAITTASDDDLEGIPIESNTKAALHAFFGSQGREHVAKPKNEGLGATGMDPADIPTTIHAGDGAHHSPLLQGHPISTLRRFGPAMLTSFGRQQPVRTTSFSNEDMHSNDFALDLSGTNGRASQRSAFAQNFNGLLPLTLQAHGTVMPPRLQLPWASLPQNRPQHPMQPQPQSRYGRILHGGGQPPGQYSTMEVAAQSRMHPLQRSGREYQQESDIANHFQRATLAQFGQSQLTQNRQPPRSHNGRPMYDHPNRGMHRFQR